MSFRIKKARFLAGMFHASQKMAEHLQNPPRDTDALNPDCFSKKVRVKRWSIDGFRGVTVNGSYPGSGHVLMLPGGAYTLEPGKGHREIVERFVLMDQLKVSLFEYPLSPEFTAATTHQALFRAYQLLISQYPDDTFYLFGDFSGGGLALSFLQQIAALGNVPMPAKTAVVSPWLDIALTNPKIKIARKSDPILPVEALVKAGERYRGFLDAEDPLVSPIFGSWEKLGRIFVFSGTEEILMPDCELLAEKTEKASGTELIYRKAAGMIHDWILIPSKEREAALDLIAGFFLESEEEGPRTIKMGGFKTQPISE